jgi:predicted dehydrogenase
MAAETIHFLEAVALDRPVLVTPEHARMVMEVYLAADRSAETHEPVSLPFADVRRNTPPKDRREGRAVA